MALMPRKQRCSRIRLTQSTRTTIAFAIHSVDFYPTYKNSPRAALGGARTACRKRPWSCLGAVPKRANSGYAPPSPSQIRVADPHHPERAASPKLGKLRPCQLALALNDVDPQVRQPPNPVASISRNSNLMTRVPKARLRFLRGRGCGRSGRCPPSRFPG